MAEPTLDSTLLDAQQKANEAELQKQMVGRYLNDPLIQATHGFLDAVKGSDIVKTGSDIVKGAATAAQGVAKDVLPIITDPRFESVGLGLTTGGTATGDLPMAASGVAMVGMAKFGKVIRPRFNVEPFIEKALSPAPLATKIEEAITKNTGVLTDEQAHAKAQALVQSGGVSVEALKSYAPGANFLSPSHAIGAAEVLTTESRTFLDTAKQALATGNTAQAQQALHQLDGLLAPTAGIEGAITATGQTLRLTSSADLKALQLILERGTKLSQGLDPLQTLEHLLKDPATDPAALGKSVTQTYRNIHEQAKEIVEAGDTEGAKRLLAEVKDAVTEEAQLSMFPSEKEIKAAIVTHKNVTAQHIAEANQAKQEPFKLAPTPTNAVTPKQTTFLEKPIKPGEQVTDDQIREFNERLAASQKEELALQRQSSGGAQPKQLSLLVKPIKPGQQLTDDQLREYNRQVALAAEEKFSLTRPSGGGTSPRPKQTDFVAEDEKNRLATVREHQAQDMRASEGTSAFDRPRKPFKLTPPPGGAPSPRRPIQTDLLELLANETQPDQLALEMTEAVGGTSNPEISKQFTSLVNRAQKALASGDSAKVKELVATLQKTLTPPVKPLDVPKPSRLVKEEKKRIADFLGDPRLASMSEHDVLRAFLADPNLTPDALIRAAAATKHPGWQDAGRFFIVNNMLSPTSDFVNFVATGSMIGPHIAARTVAGRVGQAERLLGGKGGVLIGEDEAMIHGLFSSFWGAMKLGADVAKTGTPKIGPQAAVREIGIADNPLSAQAMFQYSPMARRVAGIHDPHDAAGQGLLSRAGFVTAALNTLNVTLGLPGRLMLTGDQMLQYMSRSAEINALTYRTAGELAMNAGMTEKEFYQAYRPLWRHVSDAPPAHLREQGDAFALDLTLNKDLGALGGAVMGVRGLADRYTGLGGTITLPFFKTLVNGAKQTWEFSPMAPLSQGLSAVGRQASETTMLGKVARQYRDDMFGDDPVKRQLATGKWAVGTMVMGGLLWAAVNGRLRGRSADQPELRLQERAAEGLPDSFVYNADDGSSIQLNRLGVLGNLAGMAADLGEVYLQSDDLTRSEIAHLLTTAFVSNFSFDFMQNSAGALQALANGVKRPEDIMQLVPNMVNPLVPMGGTLRSAERLATPSETQTIKDANDAVERIMARLPGYDSLADKYGMPRVKPLRNQFGYAVTQPTSAWGTEWFNPLYVSRPSQDDVLREVSQIEMDLGMAVQPPPRNVMGKRLTNDEYEQLQILAGDAWEKRATALLPTLQREDITDEAKRRLIESHLSQSTATAARQLMGQEPELVNRIITMRQTFATQTHTKRATVRGNEQP